MLTNDDKKWIREEIKNETEPLKADVSTLKADVSTLKADVSTLKADVSELKADVSELKADVSTLKADMLELKEGIKQINLTFENHLIPLLTEVASAYSGSDLEFQKRAESIGEMQEDMIINQRMIQNHEIRIKVIEARQNMKEATESLV